MANVLNSIMNIIESGIFTLNEYNNTFHEDNRMNNMGRALEEFVKDSYTNTIQESDINKRLIKQNKIFDYTGNNTNPPDAMLKGGNNGDAIEVKKIEGFSSDLALNSSFPNHKAYKNSPMINKVCKEIPNWDSRDILYVIGCVDKKTSNLNYIFMVYGLDYAADNELYEGIKQQLKNGINSIPNFNFRETNELGRLNGVDPLGITYLRMRGMWGIENPIKLFQKDIPLRYYNKYKNNIVFVVNNEKWESFDNRNEFIKFASKQNNLNIRDIKIQNPNNPVDLKDGKLIIYSK